MKYNKPSSFHANNIEYQIIYEPMLAEGLHGQRHDDKPLMRVSTDNHPIKQSQTLIHEMLHAIFAEWGILHAPSQNALNEELVRQLTPAIHHMLIKNDFSWLYNNIHTLPFTKVKRSWWRRLLGIK